MSDEITFNVGGQSYQVSKSLLNSFPNSMLARMVSTDWMETDNDDTTENGKMIFIERDGTKFGLVLDYLRDSIVELPLTVSKGAFLAELSYYCIDIDDPSSLVLYESATLIHGFQYLHDKVGKTLSSLEEKEKELKQQIHDILILLLVVGRLGEGDIDVWKIRFSVTASEKFKNEENNIIFKNPELLSNDRLDYFNEHLKGLSVDISSMHHTRENIHGENLSALHERVNGFLGQAD